jgi:hypothetical protein
MRHQVAAAIGAGHRDLNPSLKETADCLEALLVSWARAAASWE